jgi:hypothetical protein
MFVVSLIEFSKHVQNEISAKVMPKAQNFAADFVDRRGPFYRSRFWSVLYFSITLDAGKRDLIRKASITT